MERLRSLLAIATVAAVGACTGGESREAADEPVIVTHVGFKTPESVLHDPLADVYLVSNINGGPLDKDDNGFISRVAPDGTVLDLRWIDGASADVTLNAPKGMAIKRDTLFVADIDAVRMFDRRTGAALGTRQITGATFLNDMAVGPDGAVYVTDSGLKAGTEGFEPSGTDAVYKFAQDGQPLALVSGAALGRPNGIVVDGERVVVVTYGSGRVFLVQRLSGQVSGLPAPEQGSLDGVVAIGGGDYLIASWDAQAVYRLEAGGQYTIAVDSVEAPADIGYDTKRNRVLIPLFMADRVEFVPLSH